MTSTCSILCSVSVLTTEKSCIQYEARNVFSFEVQASSSQVSIHVVFDPIAGRATTNLFLLFFLLHVTTLDEQAQSLPTLDLWLVWVALCTELSSLIRLSDWEMARDMA